MYRSWLEFVYYVECGKWSFVLQGFYLAHCEQMPLTMYSVSSATKPSGSGTGGMVMLLRQKVL